MDNQSISQPRALRVGLLLRQRLANFVISYVINLDRDHERLDRMASEAKRAGLSFVRFAAIDGNELPVELRAQFFSDTGQPHEPALTPGEIGCYASHLSIHELLLSDKNNDYALVLEDDVRLSPDLLATIDAILAVLPKWDIIRLSNATKSVALPVASLPNGREIARYWTVPNGAGAYLISRSGAEKSLKLRGGRTLPIDEDLRRPWRSGLDTYGVLPPPVEPDVFGMSRIASMGRPDGVPARRRFKGAAHRLDRFAVWTYRLKLFGPTAFLRALIRSPIVSTVKRTLGPVAAERFFRL